MYKPDFLIHTNYVQFMQTKFEWNRWRVGTVGQCPAKPLNPHSWIASNMAGWWETGGQIALQTSYSLENVAWKQQSLAVACASVDAMAGPELCLWCRSDVTGSASLSLGTSAGLGLFQNFPESVMFVENTETCGWQSKSSHVYLLWREFETLLRTVN